MPLRHASSSAARTSRRVGAPGPRGRTSRSMASRWPGDEVPADEGAQDVQRGSGAPCGRGRQ
eukprot:6950876-Alexandrium_andersonii.AAC.1